MNKQNTRAEKLTKIFTQHPKFKELHVTSDVQAFTSLNAAESHAGALIDKKVVLEKAVDYVKVENQEPANTGAEVLALSIPNLKEPVSTIESIEELEALADSEKAGQNRVGALEVIADRIKEITDAIVVVDADVDAPTVDATGDTTDQETK